MNELGIFKFDQRHSWFEGQADWLGKKCTVYLDTDIKGGQTADKAFQHLKTLYADLQEWDKKFRTYAAEELTDFINELFYEENPLTEQQFAERLFVAEMRISPSGEIVVYYVDEIFDGQAVQVLINSEGELILAELEG